MVLSTPVSVYKILFHSKDYRFVYSSYGSIFGRRQRANDTTGNLENYSLGKHQDIDTNKDLIIRLLLTSDPFIANLRSCPETIRGKISNEASELLEIRARAPFEKDAILSESSDIEESKSDLEESDLDSE
ncbi:hypothetical protein AVEN_173261-1 [Araneus ventricosus]|uniref:Uncharacterized protein n=1 Tax=Araneus ventricosus TaxID=182803 RepID=A0A4Y2HFN6_ARAVE|nr:hypothetical protein AVEN_173261-1 [Araneus ventricosus]